MAVKFTFVGLLLFVAVLQTHSSKNDKKRMAVGVPNNMPGKLHIFHLQIIPVPSIPPSFFLSCVSLFSERCCSASNFDKEGVADREAFYIGI